MAHLLNVDRNQQITILVIIGLGANHMYLLNIFSKLFFLGPGLLGTS